MQVVYFSHGGGPLPILGDPGYQALVDFLRQLPAQLARPDAIVVVSAHWEEDVATLTGAADPQLTPQSTCILLGRRQCARHPKRRLPGLADRGLHG